MPCFHASAWKKKPYRPRTNNKVKSRSPVVDDRFPFFYMEKYVYMEGNGNATQSRQGKELHF